MSILDNMDVNTAVPNLEHYYMDIINCMPGLLYWVDVNCMLVGCNHNFLKKMHIDTDTPSECTPYDLMLKNAGWSAEEVDTLRLDDMAIIFSGESQLNHSFRMSTHGEEVAQHYSINRIPLIDPTTKKNIGLVVSFSELPIQVEAPKASAIEKTETTQINSSIPKILMVEDNVIAQSIEKRLFTELNCEVDVAVNTAEALKLFEANKYDLIIMDIAFDGTTGYDISEQLRSKENLTEHKVPIVALTAYQADNVRYDCRHYTMEGVISKPLNVEQAQQLISRYVFKDEAVNVHGLKLAI